MDGVLADSEPVYHEAMQSLLTPLGKERTDQHQQDMMGSSIEDTWRYLGRTFEPSGPLGALIDAYDQELRRQLALVREALPGARELVASLRARGVPVAVASSSLPAWIEALLGGIGLADAFDAVVSATTVDRGKPAPDIYREAAARLGVAAESCVAIEDTPTGLAAAKAVGMLAVQVRAASTAWPPLPAADLVLNSLSEFELSLLDAVGGGG